MSLQYATFKGLRQFAGQEPNWSGLLTGPLESLLQDPLLQASTQWLSFPSEEFEALSRLTAVQKIPFDQLFHLAIGRRTGEAVGVENALLALQEIQQQAKALGKRPQFVLVSHSSGARSVIKFLERAASFQDSQGLPLHFPLVITIDPVCEAHRVMGEAFQELQKYWLKGLINRLLAWLNRLPWVEFEPSLSVAPQVRHRAQPDCLYAPANVGQFVSFYQQQDIEGLRMEPHFGIHGSPVQGAINLEIQAVGTRGHSEISYHPDVTRVFVAQLKAVLEAAEPSE